MLGPAGLNEAADYALQLGLLRPKMMQVPHHGSRRNVTPKVLDRWIGGRAPNGTISGGAVCSVGKEQQDYPRGQINNAFLRRGYPVYTNRGITLMYHEGSRRQWGPVKPLPFAARVEDKAG